MVAEEVQLHECENAFSHLCSEKNLLAQEVHLHVTSRMRKHVLEVV